MFLSSGERPSHLDGETLDAAMAALERETLFAPLLGRLAHDIRSPLNAAHLHLTLLRRLTEGDGTPEQLLEWIRQLAGELRRLEIFTEAFSCASPPPLDEEEEAVNLQEMMTQTAPAANALAGHLGLSFEITEGGPSPIRLQARPKHLRRDLLEVTARVLTSSINTEASTEDSKNGLALSLERRGDTAVFSYSGLSIAGLSPEGTAEPNGKVGGEILRLGGKILIDEGVLELLIPLDGEGGGKDGGS